MGKYFGTDGIRGKSNAFPIDAETCLKIGMAAGAYFTKGNHKHRVIIGKDTRLSGYMVEQALTAGFLAMGMDVFLVGPLPTPAVAMCTRSLRADVGVMISASHNPYYDNGIKLFQPNGLKLSDTAEDEIEKLIESDLTKYRAKPQKIGRAKRIDDSAGRYIEFTKQTFPKRLSLDGLKIVLDCSNGAGYKVAPAVLWELGADVVTIFDEPDGFNINKNCGSTYPKKMAEKVLQTGADLGIALDGDGDRVILADEKGNIIDGDQVIASIAKNWQERRVLKGGGIATTVMSNMGLEKFLEGKGLRLVRTKVGDRYVMEAIRDNGFNLGGEQSGHIIFNDYTTTGDGLVAGLQALAAIVQSQKPASEVLNMFKPYPQILKNVRYNKLKANPLENENFKKLVINCEKEFNNDGRILIRKSGTEPLIRIMTEGSNENLVQKTSEILEKELIKIAC
jgi:phosphoglucosamine mutase